MAKKKSIDGVIESVRYTSNSAIDVVRFYERRGEVYQDLTLLSRKELIRRLQEGHHIFTGKRIADMANTFSTSNQIQLYGYDGNQDIGTDEGIKNHDFLNNVPLF